MTVVVHVEDVNDNPPTISVNTLTADGMAEVAENSTPGTFVAYVAVADADFGINSDFRCAVAPTAGNEQFTLRQQTFADSEFQLVTSEAAEFDRERKDRHDVTITCVDGGSPALTSNAVVRVRVRDSNDNSPRFSRELYEFRIDENCAVGTPVGVVSATDDDDGANGDVEYRLQVRLRTKISMIYVIIIIQGVPKNGTTLHFPEYLENYKRQRFVAYVKASVY